MVKSSLRFLIVLLSLAGLAAGQALTPAEIKQPRLRALQEKYFADLQNIGSEVQAHVFPFDFYLSRTLDLELPQQLKADQRAIRFDTFENTTVVEVTGNYFGSYSADLVPKGERALRTYQDVMVPILAVAMPVLRDNPDVDAFAMEISHRVRGKAMGLNVERPENLVLVLPRNAATRLAVAQSEEDRQAALLEGQFYINGEPFVLYLSERAAEQAKRTPATPAAKRGAGSAKDGAFRIPHPPSLDTGHSPTPAIVPEPPPTPPRDLTAEGLAKLQAGYQQSIDAVVKGVDAQAHFVTYAPPSMVAFRKQAYLEFSVNTTLPKATGSRYQQAALAFDEHVSHLIRPIMLAFKGDVDFDGIAFSTTVHATDKPTAGDGSVAVEFFFPLDAVRCYESFDCTGQQLIDRGAVLINGERSGLDLQAAEASAH